jgi:putative thiamine transport system ATP-binding protein
LKVKDLTIEPLFREVNFCVPCGEIVTLMGLSGSGKSTLFPGWSARCQMIFRQGELWLDERRCDGLPVESRGLGILFQDALLFDAFSVGQNLPLALPERIAGRARREAVELALNSAGLGDRYASD